MSCNNGGGVGWRRFVLSDVPAKEVGAVPSYHTRYASDVKGLTGGALWVDAYPPVDAHTVVKQPDPYSLGWGLSRGCGRNPTVR